MGNGIRFAEDLKPIPLLSPVDITETATPSAFVNLKLVHWLTFLVFFGTITGDSVGVLVEASATGADSDPETALAFKYRKSAAVNSSTWGDVQTATAAGTTMTASDDDKILLIDVDPSEVEMAAPGEPWVRVRIVPGSSSVSACEVSVAAIVEPRYKAQAPLSDT